MTCGLLKITLTLFSVCYDNAKGVGSWSIKECNGTLITLNQVQTADMLLDLLCITISAWLHRADALSGCICAIMLSRDKSGYRRCLDWCLDLLTNYTTLLHFTNHCRTQTSVLSLLQSPLVVSTTNYNSLTELHTPNITVTTADIKSSLFYTSRFLVTAFNSGDSLASVLTALSKSSHHTPLQFC
jgi:hypothetical protein